MGFFKFGKNRDFVDLGERYRKQQERANSAESASDDGKGSNDEVPFSFFNAQSEETGKSNNNESEEIIDISDTIDSRKKKLSRRILDMTNKLEEAENNIYHLQQRIEVLERKLDVNRF